ncbi:LysM peptidoglycan-binding domain-containing protein [Paenibacillus koleovorans]|uniref:LysM peptidoglycan-binding domain-containing protein n=1 Tax=Paenibacillus koleovorans TaxID=121608 RepID=UPI000FD7C780|nr:M23 family metallopeptidase [Paenibacillus koleovorans]
MKQSIKFTLVGTALTISLLGSGLGVSGQANHALAAGGYTVKAGDSLWKIATAYGVSVEALKSVNALSSDWIYPNQQLRIPGQTIYYTATSADTMWLIGQKFGVTLQALIQANPHISNPNNIWGGLTVHIPSSPSASAAVVAASAVNVSGGGLAAAGRFPLAKGSYQPYENSFAAARTWSPDQQQTERSHEGVDIEAAKGTPVYSATSGKIIRFGWNSLGGWRVTIQATDTTAVYYAHLSGYAAGLKLGDAVGAGQLLGYVGDSGYGPEGTTGMFEPHLHFGVYDTTSSTWVAQDPYPLLKAWERKQ